jgi:hypothetical protein
MERSQAKFFQTEVLAVFLNLNKRKSRALLAKQSGLGEGSMRTILDILKQKALIESSRGGHVHSKAGREAYAAIKEACSIINASPVHSCSTLCFHLSAPIKEQQSYKLRDIAVKWGAKGAYILKVVNGELVMPPSTVVDYKEDFSALKRAARPKEGDYLILVWGEEPSLLISAGLAITAELSAVIGAFAAKL